MPGRGLSSECGKFSKRLSRYADGDLSPAEAEESGLHVESCPLCAARLEAHKKMILLLESSKDVEAPWDLDLKVLEAVGFGGARTQLRGHRVSPPLIWAASVAAMILVGAGGLALRDGAARMFSIIFGPSGAVSTEEVAGLTGKVTRYFVTVWDGLVAGLGTLQPLFRSLGAVSDAAWGNPVAMGAIVGTLALVLLFFRLMARGKTSCAEGKERGNHVGHSS